MAATAHKHAALITGASSGIGKALAQEFAAQGYDLLLTGRAGAALAVVAADCAHKFSISAETIVADLAEAEDVDKLIATAAAFAVPIEVLVNNAGFAVKGEFCETAVKSELDLIHVQLTAMLRLTKALLPQMIARGQGRILNVASVYSFAPVPYQSVYSACKAFMQSFSASLGEELRSTGVTVTLLCPGVTQTEIRLRAGIVEKKRTAGASAAAVARVAVRKTLSGKHLAVPGLRNRLFVTVMRHVPIGLVPRLTRLINNVRGINK